MPTERRFKRAEADSVGCATWLADPCHRLWHGAGLSHDLRRASRTGELASFGPIGSKSSTGMIRHTAVASYVVGSVLSTADCGSSSCVH